MKPCQASTVKHVRTYSSGFADTNEPTSIYQLRLFKPAQGTGSHTAVCKTTLVFRNVPNDYKDT